MGVSLSWLAVKGKSPEAVRNALELRSTGNPGVVFRSPAVASTSDADWYLIVARGCEVLTCTVEEHVMFSGATGWRDGQRLWSVSHRGDDDTSRKSVSEQGTLPPEYSAIRDQFFRQQEAADAADAGVDFLFEIPAVLVQTFIGYKHDESSPEFEARGFELLESARKSWFKRLFSQ